MQVRKIITKCVPFIYRILQYRQLTLDRAPGDLTRHDVTILELITAHRTALTDQRNAAFLFSFIINKEPLLRGDTIKRDQKAVAKFVKGLKLK